MTWVKVSKRPRAENYVSAAAHRVVVPGGGTSLLAGASSKAG